MGAGAKLDVPGAVTGTLALFDITKRNVLVADGDTQPGTILYSNAGKSAHGVSSWT